jgi:exodeoxyribonuclease-5
MELNPDQQKAFDAITAVIKGKTWTGKPWVGILSGYAGTGKTTLIREIVGSLGGAKDAVAIIAPTGRAALRVKEATGLSAQTIHRYLYDVRTDKYGNATFVPKVDLFRPKSGLVIVDESSMVGPEIWEDLYRRCDQEKLNLLLVGDGFQLPPVQDRNEKPFSVFDPKFPHSMKVSLTQVMRQALDSPIIRASMEIREGDALNALRSLPKVAESDLIGESADCFQKGGVVICHRNNTRQELNRDIRKRLGYGKFQAGEPLMVIRNNYQVGNYGYFNGEILTFGGFTDDKFEQEVFNYQTREKTTVQCRFALVEGNEVLLVEGEVSGTCPLPSYMIEKSFNKTIRGKYLAANLGYAMTAHKAQGSEWDHVILVMENSIRLKQEEGRRWAYTALTRAAKGVKVFGV